MPHRVTVVIPTYNRPHLLMNALRTVAEQTQPPHEVLVVNDGDLPLPDAIHTLNLPLSVLRAHTRGAVHARNHAVTHASGEIIAMLDDDDLWHPHHIQTVTAPLHAGAAFAYTDGVIRVQRGTETLEDIPFGLDATTSVLRRTNPILMPAIAYRRDLHDQHGLYDPALPYYYDWDWYLRLHPHTPLTRVSTSTVTCITQVDGGSSSDQRNPEVAENFRAFRRKHGLPDLPVHNFLSALRDPELALS